MAHRSAFRTLTGKNVLQDHDSTSESLKVSVHGVQPAMWVGSVDNGLSVTPTKDSVSVSRTGNAHPDVEVVQYQEHQKPRWIAHTSGRVGGDSNECPAKRWFRAAGSQW
ncbi:hypothetical protein OG594_39875 [Streptomyces sp. NBC_01214]|uniref:hypothetical protein n=1 Tax=Streptomyces sp. NBC_01214 TaxID=2903777 RepID=UPI00224DB8CF|nr:hypothetical protein [Streptomyces sp. NBC_01214]MCX4807690.1 hypothetical protein [Streptomyces sp. NBC_01214]